MSFYYCNNLVRLVRSWPKPNRNNRRPNSSVPHFLRCNSVLIFRWPQFFNNQKKSNGTKLTNLTPTPSFAMQVRFPHRSPRRARLLPDSTYSMDVCGSSTLCGPRAVAPHTWWCDGVVSLAVRFAGASTMKLLVTCPDPIEYREDRCYRLYGPLHRPTPGRWLSSVFSTQIWYTVQKLCTQFQANQTTRWIRSVFIFTDNAGLGGVLVRLL